MIHDVLDLVHRAEQSGTDGGTDPGLSPVDTDEEDGVVALAEQLSSADDLGFRPRRVDIDEKTFRSKCPMDRSQDVDDVLRTK